MKRSFLVAALLLGSSGCIPAVKQAVREVTPEVVKGVMAGATDPETQRKAVQNLDPKLIQEGTTRVTGGLIDGTVDSLTPEREAKMRRFAVDMSSQVLAPAISSAITSTLDSALAHALTPETREQMHLMLQAMVGELVHTLVTSIHAEMPDAEQTAKMMGVITREVSKQAALGFQDALDEVKRERETGEMKKPDGGLLSTLGSADSTATTIKIGALISALALVLGLVWAVFAHFRKTRMHKAELEERDAALLLLAETIKSTEHHDDWSDDFREQLRGRASDHKGAEYLHRLLNQNRDLRLTRRPRTSRSPTDVRSPADRRPSTDGIVRDTLRDVDPSRDGSAAMGNAH